MSAEEIYTDFRKNMAPGMVGIQTVPRNRREIYYEMGKKRAKLFLKGSDAQNIEEIIPYMKNIVLSSSNLPLFRWVLMFDRMKETLFEIDKVLRQNEEHSAKRIPLIYHYDTTFNIGKHFVSILSFRDPTKKKISPSNQNQNVFSEPIVPVAIMIHQGRLREQHEAFFREVTAQLHSGKNGKSFAQRPKVLVSDHEFGGIWEEAQSIYCGNHMKRNITDHLKKIGHSSKEKKNPVIAMFHKMLYSKSYEKFSEIKSDLQGGKLTQGALDDERVRVYLLKNIIPKIENSSGR